MNIRRRTIVTGGGAALLTARSAKAKVQETLNPLAAFVAADGKAVKVVEIKSDADKHARISAVELPADTSPYPLFKQFLTHKASAVAIYSAPPSHRIDTSFDPAKRLIFIVSGETTLISRHEHHACPAGTIIMLDGSSDLAAKAGPAGYTAIKVVLAD